MTHDRHAKQLRTWTEQARRYTREGKSADYIPALAQVDPSQLGVCIVGKEGRLVAGDSDVSFTLQSISKIISFMVACLECGIDCVLERVDVEPTGDAFDSIIRLEASRTGKPFNPMINAGALTIASLLPGGTPTEKLNRLQSWLEMWIGRRLPLNQTVFESEWKTANRNRAIAYYLKETDYLQGDVEDVLEVYLKLCSLEVRLDDLALIGWILALDGYHPLRQTQVIPKRLARLTKAIMVTCGMYNASGKFAAFVGLPAKSGVSGGILCAMPPRLRSKQMPFREGCGIGVYGPAIGDDGNSVAGVKLLQQLSEQWDVNLF
ncbi:glutaminase A [Ammoniphilus oxalaticus]|uniref:Glutaminase n=1 Tax=Ammoniphilus oxalaticus TaxID=66863 RepID=A0A419SKU5_9BACL|nr:glutaminase [Ammoniphilus oxalaticus]RKD24637.1 glutaminase A [Ammoniphilus oxalaticus]